MPATFACSGCGFQTKVKDQLSGKKIKCPKCGVPGVVATPAAEQEDPASDAFMKVNLGKFQDVVTEEGEELPPEMAGSKPVKSKKKKKKKKSKGKNKYEPVSSGVKGAAVLFSLLSVGVIAMLVMFALPEVLAYLEPRPASDSPPPAAAPAQPG